MAHWAAKGVKCVSLSGVWFNGHNEQSGGPQKGDVCTVSDTHAHQGRVYISLEGRGDFWFLASAFRPLVSKDDDIAMFQRIADKAQNSIQVSEDA